LQPTQLPPQQSSKVPPRRRDRLGSEIAMRAIGFVLHDLLSSGN
jgi:hypothetical protein